MKIKEKKFDGFRFPGASDNHMKKPDLLFLKQKEKPIKFDEKLMKFGITHELKKGVEKGSNQFIPLLNDGLRDVARNIIYAQDKLNFNVKMQNYSVVTIGSHAFLCKLDMVKKEKSNSDPEKGYKKLNLGVQENENTVGLYFSIIEYGDLCDINNAKLFISTLFSLLIFLMKAEGEKKRRNS